MREKERDLEVCRTSDNVFEDLGLPEPEKLELKASLASRIGSIIQHRHITQTEAAEILGTEQPRVSALVRGELYGFSVERLFEFLTALGRDVEITIRKRGKASERGRVLLDSGRFSK